MKKKSWIIIILILILIGFSQSKKEKDTKPSSSVPKRSPSQVEIPAGKKETEEIRPELVEFLDAYEACIDEYIKFKTSYNPSDLSLLGEYMKFTQTYLEFGKKAEEWKETKMNDKELLYYAERLNNINIKLLEASSETEENQ